MYLFAVGAEANMVNNGGFESWTDNKPDSWLGANVIRTKKTQKEVRNVHSGSAAAKITWRTQDGGYGYDTYLRQAIPVIPGCTYTLSAHVHFLRDDLDSMKLTIGVYASDSNTVRDTGGSWRGFINWLEPTSGYTKKTLTFRVPEDAEWDYVTVCIKLGSRGLVNAGTVVDLDDVRLDVVSEMVRKGARDPYKVRFLSAFKDRPDALHNLVDNSSFELGLKNWEVADRMTKGSFPLDRTAVVPGKRLGQTQWEIDESTAFHGRKSLKIYSSESPYTCFKLSSFPIPKAGGGEYTISAYMKSDRPGVKVTMAGKDFTLSRKWKHYSVNIPNFPDFPHGKVHYTVNIEREGEGTIWIDAVQLEKGELTPYQIYPSVEMGLSTSKINNIYYPDEPILLSVNLFNAIEKPLSAKVDYYITDFRGKVIEKGNLDFHLSGKEGKTKQVKMNSRKGYFEFSAFLEGKEDIKDKKEEISFGVISPLSNLEVSKDSFFALSDVYEYSKIFPLYEQIGTKWGVVYNVLYWYQAPQGWKNYNPQWERMDRVLSLMEKHHITPVVELYGIPHWISPNGKSLISPDINNKNVDEVITDEVIKGWKEYTYEVVKKYKDRVKHWSIFSEFFAHPVKECLYAEPQVRAYVKILKASYEVIKKEDPTAIIGGYGAAAMGNNGPWGLQLFEKFAKAGGLDYVDVVTLHTYKGNDGQYSQVLKKLKELIKEYNQGKEKDIWITENGSRGIDIIYKELVYSYHELMMKYPCSELKQAENAVRMNVISLAEGVKRCFQFAPYAGHIYKPFAMGLHNFDLSPKKAYVAYNNMVNILRGADFEKEINVGEMIKCYQFDKDGKSIIIIWTYGDELLKVKIPLASQKISAIDMVGGQVFLEKDGGNTSIELTGSPLYLIGKKPGIDNAFNLAELMSKSHEE